MIDHVRLGLNKDKVALILFADCYTLDMNMNGGGRGLEVLNANRKTCKLKRA